MDVPPTLLVLLMFTTILGMGIANVLTDLADSVHHRPAAPRNGPTCSG